MPRVIWKGAISFGLVHVPVALHPASSESGIDFDWRDKRSMDPVAPQRADQCADNKDIHDTEQAAQDNGPARRGPRVMNMPGAAADGRKVPSPNPPDLCLPRERDQSVVGTTAAALDPMMVQAAKDLDAGLVDTDMRNTAGPDSARRQKLLKPNSPA